tara:strand:+ start:2851 stop:3864 length:1014 start_codon:yes stop_codon:yes gene_type:complete
LELTLGEIASQVGGTVQGNPDLIINGVSEIQNSIPGTITFLSNPKYKKYLSSTQAAAVFVDDTTSVNDGNIVFVPNPQLAMAKTLSLFYPENKHLAFIHQKAIIDPTVSIGENVSIGPGVIIESGSVIGNGSVIDANTVIGENVTIGKNCQLKANVTIYFNTIIGENVVIHSGTTIGCDGFGFVTVDGIHEKIPQIGNVKIGDNVEIGSNCAIDRATIGTTFIGEMTKLDNLVHIAHNVKIGKGCLITGAFAIAGSSKVGDYCTFAGQVGVAPHVNIGPNATFAAKSGVTKSLVGGKVYAGFPAREIKEHNKREAVLTRINQMRKKLDQLIVDQKVR